MLWNSLWFDLLPGGWFLAGYGPFRRISGGTADAERLNRGSPSLTRLTTLFREDAALVESVHWLQEIHVRALEKKNGAEALKQGVLRLLGDGLLPAGTSVIDVDSEGLWVEQAGLRLSLQELSDGYRAAAALVLDLVRLLQGMMGDATVGEHQGHPAVLAEGVVLIDEIDAHLHIAWQKRIGFWLKDHFPNIQFIVTTHSPFICQAADPGGLFLLPGPGEAGDARKLTEEEYWRVVNGGADDAVLSPLFGLDHSHSQRSEEIREELAALEVKLMQPRTSAEDVARYKELRARLPDDPEEGLLRAWEKRS
jgi:hypothetical protein